jgi:hypothetical protein
MPALKVPNRRQRHTVGNDPIYRSFLVSDSFFSSATLNDCLSSIKETTMYAIKTMLAAHMAVIAA